MFEMKEKNNSYETEPSSSSSSGSGHSLCGGVNNDYLQTVEVENIKLPLLLVPRNEFELETFIEVDNNLPKKDSVKDCNKSISAPSSAVKSSQESDFTGFAETPIKKWQEQRFIYEDTTDLDTNQLDKDDDVVYVQTYPIIKGDVAKKVIYDTIVEENSSNAVDMPLAFCQRQKKKRSNEEIMPPENNETVCEQKTLDLNSSSFFKYSASPDLFADDDDEEDDDGDDNNNNVAILPPPEHDEVKSTLIIENIAQNIKEIDTVVKDEPMNTSVNRSLNCPTESSFTDEQTYDGATQNECKTNRLYRDNCKRERDLLRRIRKCLSGVPPPPSLTIPQLDLIQLVLDRKADIMNFFENSSSEVNNEESCNSQKCSSLFKPTHTLDEAKKMPWRDILGVRQHGLSYNLTNASEHCEYLSLSVVERFVGAETTSSYRRSPSSAKKRNLRGKLLPQSPGNRLSHLAKRRAIFSSANLATTSQRSSSAMGPQIVVDKKKTKSRRKATPKRRTPGSKKKTRKTPSASARKLQYRLELSKQAPSRETSKRALFQSPMEIQQQQQLRLSKPQIKPEIATKVEKSKRALFSPDTKSSQQQKFEQPTTSAASQKFESMHLKRKRNDDNDDDDDDDVEGLCMPSKKLLRCDTSSLTPRALKIKSQSFCIGAGSSDAVVNVKTSSMATLKSAKHNLLGAGSSNNSFHSLSSVGSSSSLLSSSTISLFTDKKLQRAQSDMVASSTTSLTENQKKKLLWAVSQALQEKKITTKHENFKQHATVLARVVRRIFQEFYQRTSTSNSETLLRLAKKYVFYVISGRSCDDIYTQVRAEENKRMSTSRLSGYIGPEEYQQRKQQISQLSQLSQSSLMSSFSLSMGGSLQNLLSIDDTCSQPPPTQTQTQSSQQDCAAIATSNQTNFSSMWSSKNSKQRPIETNTNQQNSSSKSNLGSFALRENSAQKNFTGKDQRNVSPYAKNNSGLKPSTTNLSTSDAAFNANATAKAKRQIFFDS